MKQTRLFHLLQGSSFAWIMAITPAWAANTHAHISGDLQQVSIAPGDIHEVCMQLTPPQQLQYAFNATDELAFNIHYHADRQAFYPLAEHLASQVNTVFTPESGQHYCLMWTNPGNSAVELSLQQEVHIEP